MMAGYMAAKSSSATCSTAPTGGWKTSPPFVHLEEEVGGLPALRLALAPGDEDALRDGHGQLHGGEDGADRGAGGALHRELGEARQLDEAGEAGFLEEEGVGAVDVPAPVARVVRGVAEHPAVGEERAPFGDDPPRHRRRLAIQRQAHAHAAGERQQLRENRRVAVVRQDEVRVVAGQRPVHLREQVHRVGAGALTAHAVRRQHQRVPARERDQRVLRQGELYDAQLRQRVVARRVVLAGADVDGRARRRSSG
jgi:hypothetical protein